MSDQKRVHPGVREGGQFATSTRAESDVTLAPSRRLPLPEGEVRAAHAALWRTALDADEPDLYAGHGDFVECLRCGAVVVSVEVQAHTHADHRDPLTADDIDDESRARIELDFDDWLAANGAAVTMLGATMEPVDHRLADTLARGWWLTRNGRDGTFRDLLEDDPQYQDADRERAQCLRSLEDSRTFGANATALAQHEGRLDGARDATTLDVLRRRAQVADQQWRSVYGAAYRKLHDGRSTAKTYAAAADAESRATQAKVTASAALRRAEALLALDAATAVDPYDVQVRDGKVVVH